MSPILEGPLRVLPTEARHHARRALPYVVAVHPSVAERAGTLGLAGLERRIPSAPGPMAVVVRVLSDASCSPGEIRIDQTVRTALGLAVRLPPSSGSVDTDELVLHPITVGPSERLRNLVSGIVGRRYLLLRVAPPRPNDIEKGICRVGADDQLAVGSTNGSRLVLFGAQRAADGSFRLTRTSMQGLALDPDVLAARQDEEDASMHEGWSARYVCARAVLGIDGTDLAQIFLDKDARDSLGVAQAWPVLVRRDSWSAFVDEMQDFGIASLASLLALQGLADPLLESWGMGAIGRGIVIVFLAVALALAIVVFRLRADLR